MANFQDYVVLNSDTLSFLGNQLVVGNGTSNSASIVWSNSVASEAIYAAPTANRTQFLQDANGTIALLANIQNLNVAAGTQTGSTGTIVFVGSNGVTFGMSGSSQITASVAAQSVQPGIVAISASTQQQTTGTVVFSNSNNITFGMSSGAGGGTITASFANPAGAVAIAAGTQTGSTGTIVFSNSNGFTFGMSNSSVVTLSYSTRISAFSQWAGFETNYSISNQFMSLEKMSLPMYLSATQLVLLLALSGHTNSSGTLTISHAIYTNNAGTLSLATSTSAALTWGTGSNTSASSMYGGISGTRYFTIPISYNMPPGDYMAALNFNTSNDGTWRFFGRQGVSIVGTYAGVETATWLDGYSGSSTAAFPGSIALTNTNFIRTGAQALEQPGIIMLGS